MQTAGSRYTRSEVVWLLSMTHERAVDLDAYPRDSCANLHGKDDEGGRSRSADNALPVLVRWQDVQRAKRQVVKAKEGLAIMQLVTSGYSEREIAGLSGRDHMAVRRRWHASVDEILTLLGGADTGGEGLQVSQVSACLVCGQRPRVRLAEVRRKGKGGWKIVEKERQASCCEDCLAEEYRPRILRAQAVSG